jgi:hypothetical protein
VSGEYECIFRDEQERNPNYSQYVRDANGFFIQDVNGDYTDTVKVAGDVGAFDSTWWTSMSTPYGYTYDGNK